ncbi:unnamed protein product, partial [Tetraodon nigroviridis]
GPSVVHPIVEEWYYQVEVLKLEVGDQNLDLDCREYNTDKAIVDSGTTLLRLPVPVFNALVDAITRSSLLLGRQQAGLLDEGRDAWRFFPKLSIYLRATNTSQSFRITILPQYGVAPLAATAAAGFLSPSCPVCSQLYIQQITDLDGTLDCFRFGVSSSVNGLVIGATVMEGFYVVFDRAQRRLGFRLQHLRSQRRAASLRDRGALLGRRRGVQLLRRRAEGTRPLGAVLCPDRRLRPGPRGPAAAAAAGAVPSQEQLRRDHGPVCAGPPPHQVTERRKGGGEERRRAAAASSAHSRQRHACVRAARPAGVPADQGPFGFSRTPSGSWRLGAGRRTSGHWEACAAPQCLGASLGNVSLCTFLWFDQTEQIHLMRG